MSLMNKKKNIRDSRPTKVESLNSLIKAISPPYKEVLKLNISTSHPPSYKSQLNHIILLHDLLF